MDNADTIRRHLAPVSHATQATDEEALAALNAFEAELALSRNLYDELFTQTEQLRAELVDEAREWRLVNDKNVALRAERQRFKEMLADAEAEVETLRAERQQAQEERDAYRESEVQQTALGIDRELRIEELTDQRQQAIDALRELRDDFLWLLEQHPEHEGAYATARLDQIEALVKLGESE